MLGPYRVTSSDTSKWKSATLPLLASNFLQLTFFITCLTSIFCLCFFCLAVSELLIIFWWHPIDSEYYTLCSKLKSTPPQKRNRSYKTIFFTLKSQVHWFIIATHSTCKWCWPGNSSSQIPICGVGWTQMSSLMAINNNCISIPLSEHELCVRCCTSQSLSNFCNTAR